MDMLKAFKDKKSWAVALLAAVGFMVTFSETPGQPGWVLPFLLAKAAGLAALYASYKLWKRWFGEPEDGSAEME